MIPHKGKQNFANAAINVKEMRRPWSAPNFCIFIELGAPAFHAGN